MRAASHHRIGVQKCRQVADIVRLYGAPHDGPGYISQAERSKGNAVQAAFC